MVTKSESESAISWRYRVIYTVLLTAWIVGIVTLFNLNKGQVEGGRGQEVILHQLGQAPASGSKAAHQPMSVLPDVRDGQLAALSEYPFMAALCYVPHYWSTPDCMCGAVIIDAEKVLGVAEPSSKKYLLTAAHCLYHLQSRRITYSVLRVYMGFVDRTHLPSVWRGVRTSWYYSNPIEQGGIAIHPDYRYNEGVPNRNDIAVLKLKYEMPWVEGSTHKGYTYGTVGPINVVEEGQAPPQGGEKMRVMGWGMLKPRTEWSASPISNDLRWADVDVVDWASCDATYRTQGRREVPTTGMLCAGGLQGETGFPVTCPGDSGGPIVQADSNVPGGYTLLGITSMGIKTLTKRRYIQCGPLPGLFTEVSPHIPWIKAVLVWMKSNKIPTRGGEMPGVPGRGSKCTRWPELWT